GAVAGAGRAAGGGAAGAAGGLYGHDRLRDRAPVRSRREGLAQAGDRVEPLPATAGARGADSPPEGARSRGGLRALPSPLVPRPEAILARGPRHDGADARRADRDRRRNTR